MFKTSKKMYEKKGNNRTTGCPTKTHSQHLRHDGLGGFTLVELVITIAIVIILSVISVPIYRGYVDKAKWSEAYALSGLILTAQKTYYSEYGYFFPTFAYFNYTSYDPVLGIDARGNKYFTLFSGDASDGKIKFYSNIARPVDMRENGFYYLRISYDITSGTTLSDNIE